MAIGFGLVTGVLAIRRLAAGPVLPAEAARRERRGLWVISVAALALGTYVFETERREAVAPALRALPAGATVLYEREYYGGFPADYTYDLEARMTHGQFIEWVVALELLRVEEHPETWISEGRRCMSHARFEDGVGTYSKGCH
ncbi:MAG: hypothetical protein U0230_05040 [Polyangiales bacterium]